MTPRPLLYDITHLIHRLAATAPTGIDRVDLGYARYFASGAAAIAGAVHYGRGRPSVWSPRKLQKAVDRVDRRWRETLSADEDSGFLQTREWLLGGRPVRPGAPGVAFRSLAATVSADLTMLAHVVWARLSVGPSAPENALYLNVTQHALEHDVYFHWLSSRRDIRAVFFLHDLLPLDFPEFWWAGHELLFRRRMDTLFRHASALITTTEQVRERALLELRRRGLPEIPILACPLPSPLEIADGGEARDEALAACPYFVIVGTIEPRKNHLLLLNVWRALIASRNDPPKLVVVGGRGWENEQVVDLLERAPGIASHVRETAGLSNAGLRRLFANSRGVLVPSFAEGFGLPVVEALSLGVPVVASDIPVFRDVARNRAIFLDPTDGPGWRDAVSTLADPASPRAVAARAEASRFRSIDTATYFSTVRDFLASL